MPQGSGYSLRVSIGSLYGIRPNQILPKGRVKKNPANYPHFVDKGGGLQMWISNGGGGSLDVDKKKSFM